MTSTVIDTDPATERADWHAERERALLEPHGWLSLVALHWLPAGPSELPGVPGLWWSDRDGTAHVRAALADGVRYDGAALDGEAAVAVAEGKSSSVLAFRDADGEPADVVVEAIRRTGRTAVRVRDPRAASRAGFTGVPIAAYDSRWVIDAPARWYAEPRPAVVGAAQLGLVHHVQLVGEVDLVHGDDVATLRLTAGHRDGEVGLLFSDESADVAEWRVAFASAVPGDATVRLDLNRAVNLPYAFSDFGTCPAPVEGNHVPFAVTAGERRPVR
ncbi:DUF1684 domain-containing protein [Cellulomonas edaphi]|uniref:DUF1684 domain-containing protein n=1 Tax=Cellulomonas edaphi TaxID=3053468 RepID=A0ABT7S7S8_9CELL|nr:DUF1684 domain-containing protein [Cellulomons edaphi]MDM7831672.1 DUF1684 domain-containing protein [Cellulomons edaphi]